MIGYPERRADLCKQLEEKKEVLNVHEKQLKVYHDNFTSIDFLHVRSDMSQESPKPRQLRKQADDPFSFRQL